VAHPVIRYRNHRGEMAAVEFVEDAERGICEALLSFPGQAYFGGGMDAGEAWVNLRRTIREYEESGDLVRVRGEE
jgi:hypothetical protein